MKNVAKRFFFPLVVFSCLHPVSGFACAIVSKEQAAERHQQKVERFKTEAIAIKGEADLIFIGNLSRLTSSQQTVASPSGQGEVLQTHQAVFDVSQPIKGQYAKGQVLEYTTNKSRITIGCSPEFRQFPKENGAGELYLVYAREGKILRTNHIPSDLQVLSGWEEAALIGDPK